MSVSKQRFTCVGTRFRGCICVVVLNCYLDASMESLGTDEKRVAIEAIGTLCYMKRGMVDLLLKPAGVPEDVYGPLLYRRDEQGRVLSKRMIAPLILEGCENRSSARTAVRRIVEIAASWSSFHLAKDEYAARATVHKARELLDIVQTMEAREALARETARQEELARMSREKGDVLRKQSELLLMMFDDMARSDEAQRRGYHLQDLLNRLFDLHEIPVFRSFTRNEGGEQIDGAFKLDGWHYVVECRWRKEPADIRQLDGLLGQIQRSGKQTMGLFVSINGWSENVAPLLKQNPEKCVLLMDGYDLRCVLAMEADLRELLMAKLACLNLDAEPHLGVKAFLERADD